MVGRRFWGVVAVALALGSTRASARPPVGPRGWIESEGTFACWCAGSTWARGCEISGAIRTRRGLVVVTDKTLHDAPGRSHVWRTRLPTPGVTPPRLEEYTAPAFLDAVKFEGLAREPCGCMCFATTSFSWYEPKDPKTDPWNVLVAWRAGHPEAAQVVEPTLHAGKVSSITLIPRMRRALATADRPEGPAWFKIEGLAVLPHHRLAFGVRAMGEAYSPGNHEMVGVVIAVPYAVCAGRVRLVGPFERILAWKPAGIVGKPTGVSALAYDAAARRLVLLTSYEKDGATKAEDLDAWLWVLPACDIGRRGRAPAVVRDRTGAPLRLRHKGEAIVPAGRRRYLVIHDDDTVLGTEVHPAAHGWPRRKHEASYTYVRLCR